MEFIFCSVFDQTVFGDLHVYLLHSRFDLVVFLYKKN
jgi:hypothetical protein